MGNTKSGAKQHRVVSPKKNGLCIGCGFCAAVCPEQAIAMNWGRDLTWIPQIDMAKCTDCGLCLDVCPNTPQCISEYAVNAAREGERYGLQETAQYYIAYDSKPSNRIRSASGGAITAVLTSLLEAGEIDGVIASMPVEAPMGSPHYEIRVMRSIEDLNDARSSHYHPLCYHNALIEIKESTGRYALVGVPCIIRGINRLPRDLRSKIRYTFGLACSKNVTGQFLDCLAENEGISRGEPFVANQRDKYGGIPNATAYNTYFRLSDREIRRSRFKTKWTDMWRNYFFTPECCLYCPDFYGVDADLSVKDAWGRLSEDPLGISLLIVRNPELASVLGELKKRGKIFLEPSDQNEVFQSQLENPRFKHVEIRDRLVWKPALRKILSINGYAPGTSRRLNASTLRYWQLRVKMRLSAFLYTHRHRIPVNGIIYTISPLSLPIFKHFERKAILLLRLANAIMREILLRCRFLIVYPQKAAPHKQVLDVLISGGYGYRNVGDEAQLGANISKWKRICPEARLTVLSPKPEYTKREHGERAELAPRAVFFGAEERGNYGASDTIFKLQFILLAPHLLLNALLLKARLPLFGLYPEEVHLLKLIQKADVLFISGGGYLTGPTLSRLWDNMLLIRLADILQTPVILSGQTIGVFDGPIPPRQKTGIFDSRINRSLARWGLKKAKLIYLRDPEDSIKDLHSIGMKGAHVKSLFDDALFCEIAGEKEVDDCLLKNGVNVNNPYAVICVTPAPGLKRMAEICDYVSVKHNLQVVLLPTSPGDVPSLYQVKGMMTQESSIIDYDYGYRIAKGIISKSKICLTYKHHPIIFAMATGVPTISVVTSAYWVRKNRGALQLFGQGDWVVDQEAIFSVDAFENMIDHCLEDSRNIKSEILSRLPAYQERDGEVIREFLQRE